MKNRSSCISPSTRQQYYALITHMDAQIGRILDAMATSLAIAGFPKPKQVEFQNLLPLAKGETKTTAYDSIYGVYFGAQRMYRNEKYKIHPLNS